MTTTSLGSALRMSTAGAQAQPAASHLRSLGGALGALVLLLALPLTVAFDMLFPGHAEVVIHVLLAIGTFTVGLSVFDFGTPKWLTRTACAAGCVLAAIFFAQGLAALTQNEMLKNVAFSPQIGGWGEAIAVSTVMAWFIAIAFAHGRGATMIAGAASAAMVIGVSVWAMLAAPLGGTPAELRLLFLIPIAWLLFVSTRRSNA
jgi:hypothetical protein